MLPSALEDIEPPGAQAGEITRGGDHAKDIEATGAPADLDELDATIGEVALVMTPHLSGEPIGAKALGGLLDAARRRGGTAPPGPLRPTVDLESGTGLGSIYRMRLALPQLDPSAVSLGRVDDDLIISAGGLRRRVRLASVLRRCIVLDAHLRGSELTVRFRPDPEVWPK